MDAESESAKEKTAEQRGRRVTLRDVAVRLGVSHVTVSLALRNHPSISQKRRDEVRRLADEMGYQPDPLLSSLVVYRQSKRPVSIHSSLIWVNHWDQPENLRRFREFDAYWRGASKAAERFGYHLEEIRWTPDLSPQRFERILTTRNVRGLLIPPHRSPPDWGDFDWSKFSVIRFGLSVPSPDSHLVTADQFRAIVMAVRKIHQYGYKRIGLVVERDLDLNIGGNYFGGFSWAQDVLKLKPALPPFKTTSEAYSDRIMAARLKKDFLNWLKRHKPDAILTTDGQTLDLLKELGYRIPQDVALAATSVADVHIDTGIDQNGEAVGRIAVEMLVAQINVNERGEPSAPCRFLVESLWQDGTSLPPRTSPSV